LALDIADGIVASRDTNVKALGEYLRDAGVSRVRALEHDLPEIALLVDWAWARLSAAARRALGALAHVEGDHVDAVSLGKRARVAEFGPALVELERWRLVQQPVRERYALHAVVRYAVEARGGSVNSRRSWSASQGGKLNRLHPVSQLTLPRKLSAPIWCEIPPLMGYAC
jgi:hypothetical protein